MLSPISYALQRGILLRQENPTYRYWAPVAAATRGFTMVLFTASRRNNFAGGTCALPSALLVYNDLQCFVVIQDKGEDYNFELICRSLVSQHARNLVINTTKQRRGLRAI